MKTFFSCHLLLIVFLFTACSNDDSSQSIVQDDENTLPVITSFNADILFEPEDPNISVRKIVLTGAFVDEKISTMSHQLFIENEPGDITIQTRFNYTNGLLTLFEKQVGEDSRELIYDSNSNVIASNWNLNGTIQYYRFIHVSDTEVYFETITLPYNDPQTEIIQRVILRFDENNNVIVAGKDLDQNGIPDFENQFTFTENNITAISLSTGETANYEYTDIKSSLVYLYDNAFGKKTNRILSAQVFAGTQISDMFLNHNSTHISTNEFQEYTFETGSNNFYTKRVQITTPTNSNPSTETETVTFAFQ